MKFVFISLKKNILPIVFVLITICLVIFSKSNLTATKNVPDLNKTMSKMDRNKSCVRIYKNKLRTCICAHIVDYTANTLEIELGIVVQVHHTQVELIWVLPTLAKHHTDGRVNTGDVQWTDAPCHSMDNFVLTIEASKLNLPNLTVIHLQKIMFMLNTDKQTRHLLRRNTGIKSGNPSATRSLATWSNENSI